MRNLLLFATTILLVISSSRAEGELNHGDHCDPSPSQTDTAQKCDTSRRLSCDVNTHRCRCHHADRDFFDNDSGRCETKVGKFCAPDATFPVICVNQAVCNSTTKFCECPGGFETNDEGSECSGGNESSSSVFLSSLAMFLLLASVFVCT